MKIRLLPSQQRLKELYIYDPSTGIFTRRMTRGDNFRWREGSICGTFSQGYINISIDSVIFRAHRLAWMYMTGMEPGGHIDHINGDRSDNRWENLRLASKSENGFNRPHKKTNKLKMKGVTLTKTGTYRARIMREGKQFELGIFTTSSEAKAAYDAAAKIIHGTFFHT